MNIPEIIKNAFIFPTKNVETLSIYAILSLLSVAFAIEGVLTTLLGIFDIINLVIGIICIAIAIIIGLITRRISIQCIKSGIDLEEKLPDFKWWESLSTGFSKIVITLFYFIVPGLIVVFIGLITNLFGNIIDIVEPVISIINFASTGDLSVITPTIVTSFVPLYISLAITLSAGLIVFLICTFFQAMSEARLAHTGSLKKALNIIGAARDITMIGVGKVILISIIIFVIVIIIEAVLTFIFNQLVVLSILNIIITPYIALFSQRALGLLYSDIV